MWNRGCRRRGRPPLTLRCSPSSGTRWEGARGWQLPAGSPDSHLPFLPDKYYRINLRTKRVDMVQPRYPRSIAQYWLDCPQPGEEST